MTYELKIAVAEGKATATLDRPGASDALKGVEHIDDDPLRVDTVYVLRDWLSRWQMVSRISIQHADFRDLPVAGTFRVLGEQLYQIILRGSVHRAFADSYKAARDDGQPLRVILSFAEDSAELAALPWEFLHATDDMGRPFYLATKTELVLNRSLPVARTEMPTVDLPLRVLFIMCAPSKADADQKAQRKEILNAVRRLKRSDPRKLSVELVRSWNIDHIQEKLRGNPHVVHIIGRAHNAVDDAGHIGPEIEYPGSDGTSQWNAPQVVVEFLTAGRSRDELPRLVILHLCQMGPVDFRASFERMAPELIKAGIMAVLAMQYPVSPPAATLFTNNFYDRLIQGEEIDKIVQDIRWNMQSRLNDDLLIGTPVLYMQSLSGQLVRQEVEFSSEGKLDPHHVSTKYPADSSGDIRQRLSGAAWSEATDKASAREVDKWINGSNWSDDPCANEQQIRLHMRLEDPYVSERGPMYLAMIKELMGQQ
jgi:hypothetical protein